MCIKKSYNHNYDYKVFCKYFSVRGKTTMCIKKPYNHNYDCTSKCNHRITYLSRYPSY
jgi:hypothetical protein